MVEITPQFNTEDGMVTFLCKCGVKFSIYYGSPKFCSCGREYELKVKLVKIKGK